MVLMYQKYPTRKLKFASEIMASRKNKMIVIIIKKPRCRSMTGCEMFSHLSGLNVRLLVQFVKIANSIDMTSVE